jgi:hypothetical protein
MNGIKEHNITLGTLQGNLLMKVEPSDAQPRGGWLVLPIVVPGEDAPEEDMADFHCAVGEVVGAQLLAEAAEPEKKATKANCTDEEAWNDARTWAVITVETLQNLDGVGEHRAKRLIDKWSDAGLISTDEDGNWAAV